MNNSSVYDNLKNSIAKYFNRLIDNCIKNNLVNVNEFYLQILCEDSNQQRIFQRFYHNWFCNGWERERKYSKPDPDNYIFKIGENGELVEIYNPSEPTILKLWRTVVQIKLYHHLK